MKKFRLMETRRGDIGIVVEDQTLLDVGADVEKLIVPNGVAAIDDHACLNHINLNSVELSDSVKIIGHGAFAGCENLVFLPSLEHVTEIGIMAFYRCQIPFIIIPESIQTIGACCFQECTEATSASFEGSLKILPIGIFIKCIQLKTVDLPKDLIKIGNGAFAACKQLESISLPETLTTIGALAFNETGLKEITIPKGFHAFGDAVFQNCEALKKVVLPSSVLELPLNMFYGCNNLTTIYYDGTIAEWRRIRKNPGWNFLCPDIMVHCTNGIEIVEK